MKRKSEYIGFACTKAFRKDTVRAARAANATLSDYIREAVEAANYARTCEADAQQNTATPTPTPTQQENEK